MYWKRQSWFSQCDCACACCKATADDGSICCPSKPRMLRRGIILSHPLFSMPLDFSVAVRERCLHIWRISYFLFRTWRWTADVPTSFLVPCTPFPFWPVTPTIYTRYTIRCTIPWYTIRYTIPNDTHCTSCLMRILILILIAGTWLFNVLFFFRIWEGNRREKYLKSEGALVLQRLLCQQLLQEISGKDCCFPGTFHSLIFLVRR